MKVLTVNRYWWIMGVLLLALVASATIFMTQRGAAEANNVVIPIAIAVDIDIKPGSDPNCIKDDSKGRIPVAVLGSTGFDVNNINASTLALAGVGSPVRTSTNKDVDGDGYLDLVAHFSTPALNGAGVLVNRAILPLTGALNDGTRIVGSDQIFLAGEPDCFDQGDENGPKE